MVNTIKGLIEVTEYSSYWKSIIRNFYYLINYIITCRLGELFSIRIVPWLVC